MTLTLMIIIITFISLPHNREASEVTHPNTFLFGNNNSIELGYSPFATFAYNKSIAPTKNGTKPRQKLQQDIIQLVHNITVNVLKTNYNVPLYRDSGTSNLFISMVSNNNLMEQTTKVINNIEREQHDLYESHLDTNKCGTSSVPVNSLINGKNFKPGTWPWWAPLYVLMSNGSLEYKCGGTLISPNTVLTAANCFYSDRVYYSKFYETKDIRIGLGLIGRKYFNESNTFIAEIEELIKHPSYRGHTTFDADIAVIILKKSFFNSDRIRPVCLWTNPGNIEIKEGYVASFIKENKLNLSIFKTSVVSSNTCLQTKYAYTPEISATDRNFCADNVSGQGPCYGNTGQGFMIEENGKLYLRGIVVGIIASGYIICDSHEYGIYTDVAKFTQWVQKYVKF